MAQTETRRLGAVGLLIAVCCSFAVGQAWAANPKENLTPLGQKEFFNQELALTTEQVPLENILNRLPNKAAWTSFRAQGASALGVAADAVPVFFDTRSGAVTNMIVAQPLIPGRGVGNTLTLESLGQSLGMEVTSVTPEVVAAAVMRWVTQHGSLLNIDLKQLGQVRADEIHDGLWQFSIPQVAFGIPVRHARLAGTLNNGNLVLFGTESYLPVTVPPDAVVKAEMALDRVAEYVDGFLPNDEMLGVPVLEYVPVARSSASDKGNAFGGPPGEGYGHRLVWSIRFNRLPDHAVWETLVDAVSGDVISFQDTNLYIERQITGGVYPITSTGICPNAQQCGVMQTGWPMPFADTGLGVFTNSAGVYNYTSGTATTTLTGQFVDINDTCGAISVSSGTGSINMGGANNQHNCTTGGGSAGNTPASRSAFYEVNKLAEMARGWLPNNAWLTRQLDVNVNINATCNAFWNGSTINFYRQGGGCRNTGEIAGVFDHEWGHGIDDNDTNGSISNSGEGYADIVAIYRLNASCVGHGFFDNSSSGACGLTVDGTGRNANEAQTGASYCATDCSGVRDTDFGKHSPATPATPLGFVCGQCSTGPGPCGRQVHCSAAPVRQAAWDFYRRDLTATPFSLDTQTALMVANKVFYQGSGNIGAWHSCTCGSQSSGCGATNGYMQWLAADDNDGNINNGTPHMTAIFNAFNRHGIACATPSPVNSGCAGQPNGTAGPSLSGTPGNFSASLSWSGVGGASRYWVMRTEGHAGPEFGKTRIADLPASTTTFTDTQVANGRSYWYNVVAQGTSQACYSRVSNAVQVVPEAGGPDPDFSVSCSPSSLTVTQGMATGSSCTVSSTGGFNSSVALSCVNLPSGASCAFSPSSVSPPANGSANSILTLSASANAATGSFSFQVRGTSGSTQRNANMSLQINATPPPPPPPGGFPFIDDFETNRGWTTNPNGTDTATTGQWERGDPEQTTSGTTVLQLGNANSGVNTLVTARLAGASAGANDVDGGVTSIQSPAITLPSNTSISLSFAFYFAHLNNATNADFLRVRVVGSTTTTVLNELGAGVNRPGAWATRTFDISSHSGQTVRILIDTADAATGSLIEAGIDDVRVEGSQPPPPPPGDVFFDDFETNLGWTTNPSGTDTATTGQWERGNPEQTASGTSVMQLGDSNSGVNNLVTGRLAGASVGAADIDGGVTSIRSPLITLPSSGTITLSFAYYLAHLNNATSADFLRVSVVGNTTIQVLQELGSGDTDVASWATATADISGFAGQAVRILIEAADAATGSLVEAAIDDVRIQSGGAAAVVFRDDFEANRGWIPDPSGTDVATTGQWERGDPEQTASDASIMQLGTSNSGSNNLVTGAQAGLSVGTADIDNGVTSIASPPIDLPSDATFTLSFAYYLAHLDNATSDDFLRVSVVGDNNTAVVLEEQGSGDIDVAEWETATADISEFAGETIQMLIEAADAGSPSLVEAAVDDVEITQQQ